MGIGKYRVLQTLQYPFFSVMFISWGGMGLYRQRLKQKTLLLVVLFGFLIFLIMPGTRKESEQDLPEEGERLEIPKEEEEE